jgi:uncharacterized protein (TIGR02646 family)
MISIKKDFNDIPEVLRKALIYQKIDDNNIELVEENDPDYWNDPSVLAKLKLLYHGKCAYCETKTDKLSIDHYRPISKYWWLKNNWSNLLPVCDECKKVKGDKFPIMGERKEFQSEGLEDNNANSEYLLSEKPQIIHPEVDTSENHFYFDENGIIYGNTEKGKKNINILSLNRQILLDNRKSLTHSINEDLKEVLKANHKNKKVLKKLLKRIFEKLIAFSIDPSKEFSLLQNQLIKHFERFFLDKMEFEILSNDLKEIQEIVESIKSIYKECLLVEYNIEKFDANISPTIALNSFRIRNFKGIQDLKIDNIPLNTNFIFLTGENASGKTSILKALLVGLSGINGLEPDDINEESRIELTYKKNDKFIISEFPGIFQIVEKNIAGYGATRIFLSQSDEIHPISYSLYEKSRELISIEEKLKKIGSIDSLKVYEQNIIELLKKIIPTLDDIQVESNLKRNVVYLEKDEENTNVPARKVSFSQLAAGMRSIIGLTGDLLIRFMENQPDRNFIDFEGIVLIDEFDNHLHPKWQRDLVKKFTDIFPKLQFIISTHSSIPLLGAPPDRTVILNVNRTKEDGIKLERLIHLEKELKNMTPNLILDSDIFNHADILSVYNVPGDNIYTENTIEELEKSKDLKERLKQPLDEAKKNELLNLMKNSKSDEDKQE